MCAQVPPVPEGNISKRVLHFFWLVDYSGSMQGKKIAVLNQAIREALPAVQQALATHPEVRVEMRAIKFADRAEWHVGPATVPLERFTWPELSIDGCTATAQAIRMLAGELTLEKMPRHGLPPVCLLISDGCCTDPDSEYEGAIADLAALPWGKKAVRLAIAVGDETDYDEKQLLKFVSHPEIGVLKAHTPQELVKYIKWASITASIGVSEGKSKGHTTPDDKNVVLAAPPENEPVAAASGDVF